MKCVGMQRIVGCVIVLVLALSLGAAAPGLAQDDPTYDGLWIIVSESLALNIEGNWVTLLAPGLDECQQVMLLELDGNDILDDGAVVYTLEWKAGALVIWDGEVVFAEAVPVETLADFCDLGDLETSIKRVTSLVDLETLVDEAFAQTTLPGMAVAVVGRQGVIWSKGYGFANVEAGTPVTADTPFMLASLTKVFTGTALAHAWEAEGFDLDAPINDWLPFEVDNPHVSGEQITLRHLITHTSGLRDNWAFYNAVYSIGDSPIGLGEFLEGYLVDGGKWYDADANFADRQPGEAEEYSNIGAALAGYMVEILTGVPLDDYADMHLFDPLAMTNTHWHFADYADPGPIAVPYVFDYTNYIPLEHYGYPTWPDGQLRSSVNDMGRFMAAILNGGEFDGVHILQPATLDEMLRVQLPAVSPHHGWFWGVDNELGYAGHSGGDDGVSTNMMLLRNEGLGLVILTNSDSMEMGLIWSAIVEPIVWGAEALTTP